VFFENQHPSYWGKYDHETEYIHNPHTIWMWEGVK
jgi:hypothetical protein